MLTFLLLFSSLVFNDIEIHSSTYWKHFTIVWQLFDKPEENFTTF